MNNIDREVARHTHSFDEPFLGKICSNQENIETMWHMAEGSIRSLLAILEEKNSDPEFRDIQVFLAKCWLKDYQELDRRVDAEAAE